MPEIVHKSELQAPFSLDTEHFASSLFSSVHLFADSGEVGEQPSIIFDLLGNHDINIIYGNNGGIVDDGDLLLADNGNASLNTHAFISGIDQTWSISLFKRSRLYLIDTVFNVNTKSYQYLFDGAGLFFAWTKSTGELSIRIENVSSHRISASYTPTDGERLVIAILLDITNAKAYIVVNGNVLTTSVNGSPFTSFTSRPYYTNFIGRRSSWDNYYGWDGKLSLFAFGYDLNGQEPNEQQLIDLSLNPYAFLNTGFHSIPAHTLISAPAEQLEHTEVANLVSYFDFAVAPAEQLEHAEVTSLAKHIALFAAQGQQLEVAEAVGLVSHFDLTAAQTEQLEQAVSIALTGGILLNGIPAEQLEVAEGANLVSHVDLVTALSEQLEDSPNITLVDALTIQAITAEQLEAAELKSLVTAFDLTAVKTEQLEQAIDVSIVGTFTFTAAQAEQLEQSRTITFDAEITASFSFDESQLKLIKTSNSYLAIKTTPKFTLRKV